MKKILLFALITLLLSSCNNPNVEEEKVEYTKNELEKKEFIVWTWIKTIKNLEWVILSNSEILVTSSLAWNITYLNCENWDTVNKWDLIAKISPDYNSASYKNLVSQKSNLIEQLANLKNIKNTTLNNFSIQISNLNSQKLSLEDQLSSLKKNYDIASSQKWITWDDLQGKNIEKIESSISNLKDQIYNNIWSYLLYIDELYWVTNENDDKNDSFENYLAAKDTWLKSQVENLFKTINKVDYKNLSNSELVVYLDDFNNLLVNAYKWVNKSVASTSLTTSSINSYYTSLLSYSNTILSLKSSLSSLIKDLEITKNTYENQVLSIDSSISTIDSQIINLENTITSVSNSILSIEDEKRIQVNNLDNQIISLEQNIDSINTNVSSINIYANESWIVSKKVVSIWNNIGLNSPICEIIPKWKNTLKLKLFLGDKLKWNQSIKVSKDWKELFTFSDMVLLPTIDINTQNYVYERLLSKDHWLNVNDKVKVVIETSTNIESNSFDNGSYYIPLEYITPKLSGDYVKVKTMSWELDRRVTTWRINLPNIEILEWVSNWEILVK